MSARTGIVRVGQRVTTRHLVTEFLRGLSMVGLARKYALTKLQVEARIRRWGQRP